MENKTKLQEVIYEESLNKWGPGTQIDRCIEAMARLTEALLKLRRCDEHDPGRRIGALESKAVHYTKVYQELGEVEIMLAQMRKVFSSNSIDQYKEVALRDLKKTVYGM